MSNIARRIGYTVVNVIHPTVPPPLDQSYIAPTPSRSYEAPATQNRNASTGAARSNPAPRASFRTGYTKE